MSLCSKELWCILISYWGIWYRSIRDRYKGHRFSCGDAPEYYYIVDKMALFMFLYEAIGNGNTQGIVVFHQVRPWSYWESNQISPVFSKWREITVWYERGIVGQYISTKPVLDDESYNRLLDLLMATQEDQYITGPVCVDHAVYLPSGNQFYTFYDGPPVPKLPDMFTHQDKAGCIHLDVPILLLDRVSYCWKGGFRLIPKLELLFHHHLGTVIHLDPSLFYPNRTAA